MSNLEVLQKSPLADVSSVPIQAAEKVLDWGKTLIVAPHPDDESLGCGGAIALLREFKRNVKVLVLSDGTLSHPNSVKFPAEKLRELRETEMLCALEILGVPADEVTFLRYRDRSVPNANSEKWLEAVEKCRAYLRENQPQTILVPWRRDPHPDHRAAYSIIKAACEDSVRLIEYPIWLWEIAESADAPRFGEVVAWRLDISRTVEKKQRAIRAHASQTTELINDDSQGFRLTEDILANFAGSYEIFLEKKR